MWTGACGTGKHFGVFFRQTHIKSFASVFKVLAHSPSTMTTVPALTVATRLVAKHSHPPWWSLLSGFSSREPLANSVYWERGEGPICDG